MAKHRLAKELLYLPNILTMFRVAIIPVVLVYVDNGSRTRSIVACLLFAASAITDFLDGYLARRQQQVSLLGKFLDPLADKILVMATLVWMVPLGRIAPWVVILLLAREMSITALRSIAAAEGLIIAAGRMGKDKTALQMIGISCLIIHFPYPILGLGFSVDFHLVGLAAVYLSLVLSLTSAFEYVQMFVRAVNASDGT